MAGQKKACEPIGKRNEAKIYKGESGTNWIPLSLFVKE